MIQAPVKEETPTVEQQQFVREFIRELEQSPDDRRWLAEVLAQARPPQPQRRMSYQAFLKWADEDTLAEWVNGEVIMHSPASLPHQNIVGFLYEVLRSYTFFHHLGTVIHAPFQMKMENGREPDILFIARDHQARLKNTYLDGPADLVVEVISPESAGRDRGEKFYEYERGGVPEYWLIDPLSQRVELYQLQARQFCMIRIGPDDIYYSRVLPGFWLKVGWLWQSPLPHPLEVLGQLAGIEAQEVVRFMELLQGGTSAT